MVVLSKCRTIDASCIEYVHPWTSSCANGSCSLLLHALQHSGRLYATVYLLSLLMHRRVPSVQRLKHTLLGILQSTAFLTVNAFGYSLSLCTLRAILGNFNFLTVSFVPSFIASLFAILVERPSRRGLLTVYVTNVASETLFRMAVWRKLVRPVPHGEVIIFAASIAAILYMFRSEHNNKDAVFSMLRVAIGPYEEHGSLENVNIRDCSEKNPAGTCSTSKARTPLFAKLESCLAPYNGFLDAWRRLPRHASCPHPSSCVSYALKGGVKMFALGYGLQLCMRLLLQAKRVAQNPRLVTKMLLDRRVLNLGLFLGGFPAIFRTVSCILRWVRNKDSPLHAIPAGLLAGLSFTNYRDNSVALYAMWKLLEILYNRAVDSGHLPRIPGAGVVLYCTATATLFHAAIWEPQNLRPSYWEFLVEISGGRLAAMNRHVLDVYGLETSKNLNALLAKNKINLSKYRY